MDEFEKLRREREEADAIDLRNEPLVCKHLSTILNISDTKYCFS